MKKGKRISAKILNDISCDKLVSVIVPVYNVVDYIDGCIESILCQSYDNFELILVDDGTPDASSRKCDEYAQKDDRIIVVHKPNGGLSSARNVGMGIASGEFVIFVDSDDYIHKNYIRIMLSLQATTSSDLVQIMMSVTESQADDTSSLPKKVFYRVLDSRKAINSFDLKPTACGKLYCNKILQGVLFPDGVVNEDDATYYRFAYNAKSICVADVCLYNYFQSSNSITRNSDRDHPTDFIKIYEERIKYFKERGENQLVNGSYFRFCIVLMLNYVSYIKNNTNEKDLDIVLKLFQENYKKCNLKDVPFLYRSLVYIFHISPFVVTRLILLLHLR